MKKTFVIILILLISIVSCSTKQQTLDEYANYPVKFAKQKIEHPDVDFTFYLPKNWKWKSETYDSENILFGIDAGSEPDKDQFVDIISIQKLKSFDNRNDLKSEFEYYLELLETNWNGEVVKTGETDIFDEQAFYLHTKSNTGTYGEIETISFVLKSETEGVFYNLTASASQTDNLKMNMAMMIDCLQTFKRNTGE